MPRTIWPLLLDRPAIQIVLIRASDGQPELRDLLADTGAGSLYSASELLIGESDCLLCGGEPLPPINLGGAYQGSFPAYLLRVQIPALGFDEEVSVGAIDFPPPGFAGLACFCFLNRFTYSNFGHPGQFGLET